MFWITEDPSSGSLVQCLAKNNKYDSIVSVYMDKVGVPSHTVNYTHAQRVRICCHNTDLFHVNGHVRIILVIFSQALLQGSLMIDPL
jgi:hypothetical protein